MPKRVAISLLCCGVLLSGARAMAADDTIAEPTANAVLPLHEPPPPPQSGFWNQPTMTGDWGGLRQKLEDDGLKISPSFTIVGLGNPSGGMSQGATANGLFNFQLDFDLEKMSSGAVKGLLFHVNALYAFGPDISREYVGDFSGISPIATYNSIRLQEIWLQQTLLNERLFIRVGNLSIDNDFFVSSSSALYLNSMINTMVSPMAINVPNFPAYPLASPGVRVRFLPTPRTYVMAGVYGMDSTSSPAVNNKYGTRFALSANSGALVLTEVGYLLNQEPGDKGLTGTYRIGSFVHTATYDTWTSQAQAALGTGSPRNAGSLYGIFALAEQQVYADGGKSISLFAGGGGEPSDSAFLAWPMMGGVNCSGFIPGREHDVAGVAAARSGVSSDFSTSSVSLGGPSYTRQANVEATYRIQVTPWWYIQPDFQYIINPRATNQIQNAIVLGVSSGFTF